MSIPLLLQLLLLHRRSLIRDQSQYYVADLANAVLKHVSTRSLKHILMGVHLKEDQW